MNSGTVCGVFALIWLVLLLHTFGVYHAVSPERFWYDLLEVIVYYSSGRLALIKLLTGACQADERHLSHGCVGAFQSAERVFAFLFLGDGFHQCLLYNDAG